MAQKDISSAQREFPTITLQEGYGNTREIPINRKSLIIGRENDSDIVIAEPNVSRHHAVISSTAEGVFIEDLGSANGTFVNSAPIVQVQIKHLDTIQIGSSMLVFNDPNNPGIARAGEKRADTPDSEFTFESMRKVIRQLEQNIEVVFKGKRLKLK